MAPTRPEICAGLQGGLGNQLFQYAAGRALAARLGAELSVHPRARGAAGIKAVGLAELGLTPRMRTGHGGPLRRAALNLAKPIARALGRDVVKTPPGWRGRIHRERGFAYDPVFETLQGSWYLAGYFQSWRYFAAIADELRADLRAGAEAALPRDAELPDLSGDSVSVHLRLGDYADPANARIHGVLPAKYFAAACARIREARPDARFFLFSDQPREARARLSGLDLTVVEGGSRAADLALMARCRHHVIANSTFSWWGAWMGPGGITVAPRQWFAPEKQAGMDLSDLFPEGWIRV
ncbi:alpha-1,2-fucosyltransferase [Oceanicella actignis]|uniref:alpha-1,2-fucosyltransferase n=1 Tax=Oceanicella actignis TaxID=1189325 RepID=UPI0011E87647|nr:alpha-1,2-fucosyltransferase [Oceanicella actignis]TYO89682.1 glycosyl transferase family 11 [Oceanicella actignis]